MEGPSKLVAYPPIQPKIKLENLDEHQGLTSDGLYYLITKYSCRRITFLGYGVLDSGQSKERLQDNNPTMNVAWEEGETVQDTEMMEKLDSEDEVKHTRYIKNMFVWMILIFIKTGI